MNEGWIVLGIIVVFVVSGMLPLLRKNHPADKPPPPKETLRDWRKDS